MSKISETEEKNLAWQASNSHIIAKATISKAMEVLELLEGMMTVVAGTTPDSDVEDACNTYIDDVLPVLKNYIKE